MTRQRNKYYFHITLTEEGNFMVQNQTASVWASRLARGEPTVGIRSGDGKMMAFATYDPTIATRVARGVLGDAMITQIPTWHVAF